MWLMILAFAGCVEKSTDDTAEETEDTISESDTEDGTDTGAPGSSDTDTSTDQETDDTDDTNDSSDTSDTTDTSDTEDEPEPNPVYIGGYNTNLCHPKPTSTGFAVGDVSQDFTLTDQHGEQVSLSDFCGNTVLLVASTTWCGACRSEASDLEALYQQYKDSNFTVITLLGENNQGQPPSLSELQQWASDFGLSHPVLSDGGFGATAAYLWADPSFTGSIYLPNMQMVSDGMVVEVSNSQLSDSQIISYIQ